MMPQITGKFELSLHGSPANIPSAGTFAAKNRCAALVVPPELVLLAKADREMKKGAYQIVCEIDFPVGKNYAIDKVRTLSSEIFEADGFDILVSPGATDISARKEMSGLVEFMRAVNPAVEIRWCLGLHTREFEEIEAVLKMAKTIPAAFIRTDNNVEVQKDIKVEDHLAQVEKIRKLVATPIKISGNVNLEIFEALKDKVALFDVTAAQARIILKQAEDKLLNPPVEEPEEVPVEEPVGEAQEGNV